MTRAIVSFITFCLLLTLGAASGFGPAQAVSARQAGGHPDMMLGPGEAHVNGIKDEALIRWSKWGYVYIAGQQNSHLTITYNPTTNSLRYRDTGTKRLTQIADGCQRKNVARGIAAICKIPASFDGRKVFVQVWPRLGNDYVDGHTLPARFRLWALVDAGRDVVYGGAGDDFVNGAKDGDRVFGGAGNDWLRTGPGNDILRGGPGKDRLSCAENWDIAYKDGGDSTWRCESVRRG